VTPLDEPTLVALVHDRLTTPPWLDRDVRDTADDIVREIAPLLGVEQRRAVVDLVMSELTGLGALEQLLTDDDVQEIMVNAGSEIWVERSGSIHRAGRLPRGSAEVLLERILGPLGRRLDRREPMVDARLADGSRVCAVIPPASPDGPTFTIRRFGVTRRRLADFAAPDTLDVLHTLVERRCNAVVSGATSSGKTSLLNALTQLIPDGERLITLEDTLELALQHRHVVRLESRNATSDGVPAVALDALLRTALRLRPDRIVVGEVRGSEAFVLVQAMGTGHDGSLATIHANDPCDALRRLEMLVVQSAPNWPLDAVRDHIRAALDVIIHVERRADGSRAVTTVSEMTAGGLRTIVDAGRVVSSLSRHRTTAS
jgi:pilus assembly protein CpaF